MEFFRDLRASAQEFRHLRRIVFAALICALCVVVGALYIPVGENLRIKFTFFFMAVGSAVYGPLMGAVVGGISDILGYLLAPSGAFFPGYTLSAMLGGLVYGLLLYRKKITVLRLFLAKFIVNYAINVLLGSLWSQMLFGKGYLYYLVSSLIKNTILLPVEVLLLSALFALLIPVFARYGLLPGHDRQDLNRLSMGKSAPVIFGLDCLAGAACCLYYSTVLDQLFLRVLAGLLALAGLLLLTMRLWRRPETEA